MTTTITFSNDGGSPVPSVSTVPVVSGHSIHLAAAEGEKAVLHLSPELAAIVSPAVGAVIALDGTGPVQLTFTSSDEGAYFILVAAEEAATPPQFPTAPSAHLHISLVVHTMMSAAAFPIDQGGTKSGN